VSFYDSKESILEMFRRTLYEQSTVILVLSGGVAIIKIQEF
jgi:hypothetical protein